MFGNSVAGQYIVAPVMGKSLHNTESWGKADPYVVITLGAQSEKTEVHQNGGVNPRWQSKFTFNVSGPSDVFHFRVLDKEHIGKDDFMGEGSLPVTMISGSKWSGDVALTRHNKPAGCINVSVEKV